MVSSCSLSFTELISCLVCSLMIGYIVCCSLILLMLPLLNYKPHAVLFLYHRKRILLITHSHLLVYSYLWTVYVILTDSIVLVTCSLLLIIPTCSITFYAYTSLGISSCMYFSPHSWSVQSSVFLNPKQSLWPLSLESLSIRPLMSLSCCSRMQCLFVSTFLETTIVSHRSLWERLA